MTSTNEEFDVKKSVLLNILNTYALFLFQLRILFEMLVHVHITKTIYDSQCVVEEFWNGNRVTAQKLCCQHTDIQTHLQKGKGIFIFNIYPDYTVYIMYGSPERDFFFFVIHFQSSWKQVQLFFPVQFFLFLFIHENR